MFCPRIWSVMCLPMTWMCIVRWKRVVTFFWWGQGLLAVRKGGLHTRTTAACWVGGLRTGDNRSSAPSRSWTGGNRSRAPSSGWTECNRPTSPELQHTELEKPPGFKDGVIYPCPGFEDSVFPLLPGFEDHIISFSPVFARGTSTQVFSKTEPKTKSKPVCKAFGDPKSKPESMYNSMLGSVGSCVT